MFLDRNCTILSSFTIVVIFGLVIVLVGKGNKTNNMYILFAKMQWQKKSIIFGWIVKKAILTDKLFRAHDIPIFYVFCILPYFSSICLFFLSLMQKCKCYCIWHPFSLKDTMGLDFFKVSKILLLKTKSQKMSADH